MILEFYLFFFYSSYGLLFMEMMQKLAAYEGFYEI